MCVTEPALVFAAILPIQVKCTFPFSLIIARLKSLSQKLHYGYNFQAWNRF